MSLTVTTYEEMQSNNDFIEKDLQRVSNKIEKLQELIKDYTKSLKEELQDIQEVMDDFTNQLLYSDDEDLIYLISLEKQIDRLTIEIKTKPLINNILKIIEETKESD